MRIPRHVSGAVVGVLGFASVACSGPSSDTGGPSARRSALGVVERGAVLGGDTLRSGWYPNQPSLDPTSVGSPYFGQLFDAALEGQIYAQPLVAGGVVLVATEANRVYGLDPVSGAVQWSRWLAPTWNPADVGCANLLPTVGVTSTPAVDAESGTAYLLSKTYVDGEAVWFAHALELATGDEREGFPVEIKGAASNDPTRVFEPTYLNQRPGLLFMNGVVYAAFGAHCDRRPYSGWVVGISARGAITTLFTTEAGPARTDGAGIWQSGGGLVSDGPGQILFTTGNDWSSSPTPVPGRTPPGALGEAVVRLTVQEDGTLVATDFFSPAEMPGLNYDDIDLGSGAPVGLPSSFGTDAHRNLLVQAGKSGMAYLLDRDDLGGYRQGPGGGDRVLQRLGPAGAVWSKPSAWPGDGGWVYLPVANGCTGPSDPLGCVRAYQRGLAGDGSPALALGGATTSAFGYGSSAVVVTSDGTRSGSALLWTIWTSENWLSGWNGTAAQLRAYDAVPENGALKLRYLAGIGTGAKFTPPAIGDGRVYVGTRDGHVLGFGLTGAPPLRAEGVAFAPTLVGDALVSTVHVSASADVTLVALATSGDFSLAEGAPAVPFSVKAGESFDVDIAFRPAMEGPLVGTLQATTERGTFSIPLAGVGRSAAPMLIASPSIVTFAPTAIGKATSRTVTISNVSVGPITLTGVATPAAPFEATGVPPAGTIVPEGTSLTLTLTFAPASVGSSSAYLSVAGAGVLAAVAIEGSALEGGRLRVEPTSLDFGTVELGAEATARFSLINDGDLPVSIEKSKPPVLGVFSAEDAFPEGTLLAPGARLEQTIRAAPTVAGAAEDAWILNADDGQGLRQIAMTVIGVAPPPPAEPPPVAEAPKQTAPSDPAAPTEVVPVATITGGCAVAGQTSLSPAAALALLAVIIGTRRTRRAVG